MHRVGEARRLGCHALRRDTQARLASAVHLYRAYGFTEIPRYNDNHRADIWMEPPL
jgi:hypothetical protein